MALVKFSNGNRSQQVDRWVDDVFSPIFGESFWGDRLISRVPAVNIAETQGAYEIELAAPGLDKRDFVINVDKDVMTITVEKKASHVEEDKNAEKKHYSKREYSYTSFTRSFTLPDSVDHAKIGAEYKDGILLVSVAKKEEAKIASRLIDVK